MRVTAVATVFQACMSVLRSSVNKLHACDRRPDRRLLTSARVREVANVWNIVVATASVAAAVPAAIADDDPNHHYHHGFNVDIVVMSS